MKRIVATALLAASVGLSLGGSAAHAQSAAAEARLGQPAPAARERVVERRRPLKRVPIYRPDPEADVYPRYNPGPNAVRECTAHYVQEFRPSGTVITPRMNCVWRPG